MSRAVQLLYVHQDRCDAVQHNPGQGVWLIRGGRSVMILRVGLLLTLSTEVEEGKTKSQGEQLDIQVEIEIRLLRLRTSCNDLDISPCAIRTAGR